MSALLAVLGLTIATAALADVCVNQNPRSSCFAYGADALLEYEGIIEVTDRSPYTRFLDENGRPKVIHSYNIYAEFLREPTEEEWREIEMELLTRTKKTLCWVGDVGGFLGKGGRHRFIAAGGIIETQVYLRTPLKRRILVDLKMTSCVSPDAFESRIKIEDSSSLGRLSVGRVEE